MCVNVLLLDRKGANTCPSVNPRTNAYVTQVHKHTHTHTNTHAHEHARIARTHARLLTRTHTHTHTHTQGTASEATLVSLLAARTRGISELRDRDSSLSSTDALGKLVCYAGDQVRSPFPCVHANINAHPGWLSLA